MQKTFQKNAEILQPNITVATSNFAVQWETEKTGLPSHFLDFSFVTEDGNDRIPVALKRKGGWHHNSTEADNGFLEEIFQQELEGSEEKLTSDDTDEKIEIYCYEIPGEAVTFSTLVISNFQFNITEDPEYRIHGRNYKKRIPLCRPHRK